MFARFFQILAVSAAFSTALIGYASAVDKRRVLDRMRRIGLSIGDCDLNDISDADLDYVHRRCGDLGGRGRTSNAPARPAPSPSSPGRVNPTLAAPRSIRCAKWSVRNYSAALPSAPPSH